MQFTASPLTILALSLTALMLPACRAPDVGSNSAVQNSSVSATNQQGEPRWPSIKQALACLTQDGPIISQHRARTRETEAADNSPSGLTALRQQGFVMGEIDLARLKDGTHILFHDGVWDDSSTGRGTVAAVNWDEAQNYLLVNKRGNVTSDRPMSLNQLTDYAKGQLYLEIDFKSSSNESQIIDHFNAAGQGDHIILIAYTRSQALRLHKLSPQALIAAPVSKIGDIRAYEVAGLPSSSLLAWLGTKTYDEGLARALKERGVFSAYGMMSPKYAKEADYSPLSIIVTDYANEARDKAKLRQTGAARLEKCN